MPTCEVCEEKFYDQTEYEPSEPCWCGGKWHGDKLTFKAQVARMIFKYLRLNWGIDEKLNDWAKKLAR